MLNKYTVKNFIDAYNRAEDKEVFVKSHIIKDYIPIEEKITECKNIVAATYVKDGEFYIDSTALYFQYLLAIVRLYTNIQIDNDNSVKEFNILNKYKIFDMVIKSISDREIGELSMIKDMVQSDFIKNHNEIHSFVREQMNRFYSIMKVISDPIVKKMNETFDGFDKDDLFSVLNSLKG